MAPTKDLKPGFSATTVGKDDNKDQFEAPLGTQLWHTSSLLTNGGGLDQMSRHDKQTGLFSHNVSIKHTDAFVLTPLFITEGPLKGKHVMVLDSIQPFGFLDLPPEIRVMIYLYLFAEFKPIKISIFTSLDGPRRAVRQEFKDYRARANEGILNMFDGSLSENSDQPSNNLALLLVNKQLSIEVAAIMYGDTAFQLQNFGDLDDFLTHIGSQCAHLKRLFITNNHPLFGNRGRVTFDKLVPAIGLHSLAISHRGIGKLNSTYGNKVTVQKLVEEARPFLHALKKAAAAREVATESAAISVLDVIRIVEGGMCKSCAGGSGDPCEERWSGGPVCKDPGVGAHVVQIGAELRAAVAKELEIEY